MALELTQKSDDHLVLPETFKEPLGPLVRHEDNWADIGRGFKCLNYLRKRYH